MSTLEDARALAAHLLPPLADRWSHVQAAAARAADVASTVAESDRDLLIAAAWLHDIGYAPQVVRSGCHAIDGARFLEELGYPRRLVALVGHHSCARIEADVRGLGEELWWPLEDSAVMDALVYADMTTGPSGQSFTFAERISEILTRYAPGSEVHRAISLARPTLEAHVRRVEARLLIV